MINVGKDDSERLKFKGNYLTFFELRIDHEESV